MFCKLICLAAVAVAVFAQADKYPAGLNPALCPNYPNCDNAVVHLYRNAPAQWAVPAAREWPAGVHPAACPNYPYCDNGSPAITYASAYWAPQAHPQIRREWPAGVNPAACPNYPYCA